MSIFRRFYSNLNFRFARLEDAIDMSRVLNRIVKRMPVPSWFAFMKDEEIYSLIESEGFSILALSDPSLSVTEFKLEKPEILAMILIRTFALEKLITDILFSMDISPKHTAIMEAVVVHEQLRGKGLQVFLTHLAEKELIDRGFLTLVATVHPENTYSLNNFLKSGYQIVGEYSLYSGQRRFLVYKTLANIEHNLNFIC
ncbi:MAG TPA: GNAT family N-acetyltransferase [Christensenellaceae bacterium]|nr:GNAT family N-acetyltransferase [Christensenellaceae bacterium]